MLTNYITLSLILFFAIFATFEGVRIIKKKEKSKNLTKYYSFGILIDIAILLLFYLINRSLYSPIGFDQYDKGITMNFDIVSLAISIYPISFFLSFLPKSNLYPKDNIQNEKEIYGFPVKLMPKTYSQTALFFFYIVFGVLLEELVIRQFSFYTFNPLFGFDGDLLVIVTAILFALPHFYQGYKGLIFHFINGLILSKIFLISGNFAFPFFLHLVLNLPIIVLSIRRINDLKKLENTK